MSSPGKVWSNFTKIRNGTELKFRTEELPQDKFEDVLDLFFTYYVPQEPLHKASKLHLRAEAFEEYKEEYIKIAKTMNYQVDACYLEDVNGSTLVGGSLMNLQKKSATSNSDDIEDLIKMIKSEEIKTLFRLSSIMCDSCKIFEIFNFDTCYGGTGLVVHEDYRGLGIAGELLKIRPMICKERGVPITAAWMTSIGTQKAAAKLGWETICDLKYKDIEKQLKQAEVKFDEEPSSCKLMIIKV